MLIAKLVNMFSWKKSKVTFLCISTHCVQKFVNGVDMPLNVGDTMGVFVTEEGNLHFTINGVDKGIAWRSVPTDHPLYVVISLFESPTQISVYDRSAAALIMSK